MRLGNHPSLPGSVHPSILLSWQQSTFRRLEKVYSPPSHPRYPQQAARHKSTSAILSHRLSSLGGGASERGMMLGCKERTHVWQRLIGKGRWITPSQWGNQKKKEIRLSSKKIMKKSKQNILSTPQVWRRLIGEGRWMAPSGVITAASDTGPCLGPCGNPHHSIHLRSDKTCNCNLYAAAAAGSSIGC